MPLDGANLAQCIENYFGQSEQLDTRVWIFTSSELVCGLLIQALPDMTSKNAFDHLTYLASTLNKEECFSVNSEILLHRLFHQENINYLSVDEVKFHCSCSQKKMIN